MLEEGESPREGLWGRDGRRHPLCAQHPPECLHSQPFKPHNSLVTLEPFPTPTLLMGKLRHQEVVNLQKGCMGSRWWGRDSKPTLSTPELPSRLSHGPLPRGLGPEVRTTATSQGPSLARAHLSHAVNSDLTVHALLFCLGYTLATAQPNSLHDTSHPRATRQ